MHGCKATTAAEATRFVGCTFEDRPYHGQAAYGSFTMHSDAHARHMSFTNCRFVGTRNYLIWAIVAQPDTASFFHFRGSTFLYDYAQAAQGSYNNLQGTVFTGTTVFRDGPHRTSLGRTNTTLGNGGAPQSTVVRAPGSLQLLASNCVYGVITGLDIGRRPAHSRDSASVVIGANNALVMNEPIWQPSELYIGPTSRLIVKKGGSLVLQRHAKLLVEGQLIVENGAYFFLDPQAELVTAGRGKVRLGPQAIKGKHPTLN
ncbi:hypothetical protein [Hymenobacter coccineus]|uniref:Right handed beta helix domain-containing protein n=1 Tax=Hymenobacter coccineus TaxID=1908235 RepID=A0A1G1TGV0_9BACT|nr:hypothetical protein [Hymenobacter coccineus]OGX90104.1 hypothetical protein BEN49_07600 [Hymenobacter coccineus]